MCPVRSSCFLTSALAAEQRLTPPAAAVTDHCSSERFQKMPLFPSRHLGILSRGRSELVLIMHVPCNEEEYFDCYDRCGSRGVEICEVTWFWKLRRWQPGNKPVNIQLAGKSKAVLYFPSFSGPKGWFPVRSGGATDPHSTADCDVIVLGDWHRGGQ